MYLYLCGISVAFCVMMWSHLTNVEQRLQAVENGGGRSTGANNVSRDCCSYFDHWFMHFELFCQVPDADEPNNGNSGVFPPAMSDGPFAAWAAVVRNELFHADPFADAATCRSFFLRRWRKLGVPKNDSRQWVDQYATKVSRYNCEYIFSLFLPPLSVSRLS